MICNIIFIVRLFSCATWGSADQIWMLSLHIINIFNFLHTYVMLIPGCATLVGPMTSSSQVKPTPTTKVMIIQSKT